MDVVQPWASGFNRPKPLPTQMNLQRPQPGLSREEMLEAKRLAEETNFSFTGYQVVRREYMAHHFDPAMTVRWNSITFNNACIRSMENTTYNLAYFLTEGLDNGGGEFRMTDTIEIPSMQGETLM